MTQYQLKPSTFTAIQWTGENLEALWEFMNAGPAYGPLTIGEGEPEDGHTPLLLTVWGTDMTVPVPVGHWLVCDSPGSYDCIPPSEFELLYELKP